MSVSVPVNKASFSHVPASLPNSFDSTQPCCIPSSSTPPNFSTVPPLLQHPASPPLAVPAPLPDWSSILKSHTPTFHHVPKGARNAWAGLVLNLFCAINLDFANTELWHKLFMLPRCVLSSHRVGPRSHWKESLKIVKQRIRRWWAGDISGLWSDYLASVGIQIFAARDTRRIPVLILFGLPMLDGQNERLRLASIGKQSRF